LSHLCSRGVLLEAGTIQADTDIHTALSLYMKKTSQRSLTPPPVLTGPAIQNVEIDEAALREGALKVRIEFVSPFDLDPPIGGIVITDSNGTPILGTNGRMHPEGYERRAARTGVLVCSIPSLPLHSGEYGVSIWLSDLTQVYDTALGLLTFHFSSPDFRPQMPPVSAIGPLNVPASWRFEEKAVLTRAC
jgi:lipopolysaccharide transport system ATP-binding protein